MNLDYHRQKPSSTSNNMKPNYLMLFSSLLLLVFCILTQSCSNNKAENSLFLTDTESIQNGKVLFTQYCASCHDFSQDLIGPNLSGVTQIVGHDWLSKFITNAPEMIQAGDARSVSLFDQYKQYMPSFSMLKDKEVESILAYMHTFKDAPKKNATSHYTEQPIENPIPEKIASSGLTLVMEKWNTAPTTANDGIKARINRMVAIEQNGSERMFINELRGKLYEITDGKFQVFLDLEARTNNFINQPGFGSGLAQFEFHPEFNENGIFYTSHTEKPSSIKADFSYADSIGITVQYILTEWKMDDPTAKIFSGTRRELMRINFVTQIHGMQDINFNPTAQPGDEDYGLLYIGVGDGGAAFGGQPSLLNGKDKVWGSVLRIDPMGNNSKNGQYGIPTINPFVNDPNALGEILCSGFRNPHHLAWHPTKKTMYITDIGQHKIEELNIMVPGGDYGWPKREGTFAIHTSRESDHVFSLDKDKSDDYIYPIAQYDHDEGNAIVGGQVYQGEQMPQLKNKYILGDIVNGRVFFVDTDELTLGSQASIQSLHLKLNNESDTTSLQTLSGVQRVALRFGVDINNNLYLFTKSDGVIYKVVACEDISLAMNE